MAIFFQQRKGPSWCLLCWSPDFNHAVIQLSVFSVPRQTAAIPLNWAKVALLYYWTVDSLQKENLQTIDKISGNTSSSCFTRSTFAFCHGSFSTFPPFPTHNFIISPDHFPPHLFLSYYPPLYHLSPLLLPSPPCFSLSSLHISPSVTPTMIMTSEHNA